VNSDQAKAVCREVEEILRNHGIWYTKELVYKENLSFIVLKDVSFKIDAPRDSR
jgi:hypothetical protein